MTLITRMMVFVLFMSFSFLCGADLSDVRKGLDIQENIQFSNSEQCQNTVTTALKNNGFTVEKSEKYEQGPSIWGGDNTHKSLTKCLLHYNLVITFVIGKTDNLTIAVNLNKEIKRLVANATKSILQAPKDDGTITAEKNYCGGDFTPWGDFTSFSFVRKIETPRGFLILKAPARNAEVVKRSQDPAIFAIGYLQTKDGLFYMTKYSCERYENGDDPYWCVLK